MYYTSDGRKLKGWLFRPAPAAGGNPPVLVYFHGGFAFGADDFEACKPFADAGFVVFTPMLRGENGNPGDFEMYMGEVDDARAAAELFGRLEGQPMGRVGRMFADNKYHNHALYKWVAEKERWELVIVSRPEGSEGWVKLPIRWTVERTFAWLGKCRRLSKDRERSVLSSEAFIKLAMIHLMLNRLEPKETEAEFHYRTAA